MDLFSIIKMLNANLGIEFTLLSSKRWSSMAYHYERIKIEFIKTKNIIKQIEKNSTIKKIDIDKKLLKINIILDFALNKEIKDNIIWLYTFEKIYEIKYKPGNKFFIRKTFKRFKISLGVLLQKLEEILSTLLENQQKKEQKLFKPLLKKLETNVLIVKQALTHLEQSHVYCYNNKIKTTQPKASNKKPITCIIRL